MSGEEGTHRSSLGELQPPAPQPTGPCGSHQSSHPSADCIQLKIAPWEEGGEVESRTRAPFPETLLGGEGAHGWEGRMDINTGCEGGGFGESLDSPGPAPEGGLIGATGYQPPWVLLNRFTLKTEIGTKSSAQSCSHSGKQQEQETGG